jgi:antitoxin (DNA-binding transcriptional repressor) of toxin-antitoxin stability system
MKQVSLTDAESRLAELVFDATHGETVEIMRDGRVLARLMPPTTAAKRPIDIEALKRHLADMPYQEEDAGTFIRRMRDEDRY